MSGLKGKPNYVREWFEIHKKVWIKFVSERLEEAKKKGIIDQFFKINPKIIESNELKRLGFVGSDGEGSLQDPNAEYDNINTEDFYSDEEDEMNKLKGKKLSGYHKQNLKVGNGEGGIKKKLTFNDDIRMELVTKYPPNEEKWKSLVILKD